MYSFFRAITVSLLVLFASACGSEQSADNPARDFTLHSVSGEVSLSDYRGKLVLLFFGYTHCPDVCPATMNNVAGALSQLDETQRSRVQTLFVTVDPERDSAAHLAEYLGFFHPSMIGLTGSAEQIKQAARQFEVEYFVDGEKGGTDYTITHSSYLFLLDGNGKTVDLMSHHTSAEDIAISLRRWLNAAPS